MDYSGTPGVDTIHQDQLLIPAGSVIRGLACNDTLTASNGLFIGGPGDDTLVTTGPFSAVGYWESPGPATVDLQAGTAQDGFGTVDTLVGVHVVQGSYWADTILGSVGADTLTGGQGNDLIDGRGGRDMVAFFFTPSTAFAISYDEATGDVTVRNDDPNNFNVGVKTLRNIEQMVFGGGRFGQRHHHARLAQAQRVFRDSRALD